MGAENVKGVTSQIRILTILLIVAASAIFAISVMVSEEVFASYSSTSQASVDNTCLDPMFDSYRDIDSSVIT